MIINQHTLQSTLMAKWLHDLDPILVDLLELLCLFNGWVLVGQPGSWKPWFLPPNIGVSKKMSRHPILGSVESTLVH